MVKKFNREALATIVQKNKIELSSGMKIEIRAFLVKEHKMLMLANESGTSITDTMLDVIRNCVLTKGVDIEKLPLFDLEMLFIQIWKLSKGTAFIPVKYICSNTVPVVHDDTNESESSDPALTKEGKPEIPTDDDEPETRVCKTEIMIQVNLNTIRLEKPKDPVIRIHDQLAITMRYPTVLETKYFDSAKQSDMMDLILRCIDKVTVSDEEYTVGVDMTDEDVAAVVEHLTEESFAKMAEFVHDMPRIYCEFPIVCPSCGKTEVGKLRGLNDFFD